MKRSGPQGPRGQAIVRCFVARQIAQGAEPSLGCLHIPKTGGTSLVSLFASMREAGLRPPLYFPHRVGLAEAEALFPETRLIVVLRDPLERMASGFLSRLRCGRPRYDIPWTDDEARVFAALDSPAAFFRAVLSADAERQAAARRAMEAIIHLRRGYAAYFGSAKRVRAAASRFALIGEIGEMGRLVERIGALTGAPGGAVAALYAAEHVAPVGGGGALAKLTEQERARLRKAFAPEYEIFAALRSLPAASPR